MSLETISIVGAFSALTGAIILAFSLGSIFREISIAIGFLNVSAESIATGGNRYIFDGLKDRIDKAKRKSFIPTVLGLILLVNSFLCHAIAATMNKTQSNNTITHISKLQTNLAAVDSTTKLNQRSLLDSLSRIQNEIEVQQERFDSFSIQIDRMENIIETKTKMGADKTKREEH